MIRIVFVLALLVLLPVAAHAQKGGVEGGFRPDQQTLSKIAQKHDELGKAMRVRIGTDGKPLPDLQIYHRAARLIVENNDFHFPDSAKWTLEMLEQGLKRATQPGMAVGPSFLPGTRTVRGYRSKIDGSVQPYVVSLPLDYGKDSKITWRIDVVLHGRNNFMTEAAWIRSNADRPAGKEPWIQIEVYGRGNNAYRWAGETDVFEALEDFFHRETLAGRANLLDRGRLVLRGFSMGGAGTWHLGLHHPDRWCAIGPGAGFSNTVGLPKDRPKVWDECLHIYDAVDYAANAFMVPVAAYSGADDPQKAAADNIEARLKGLDLSEKMTHLVAPNTKHVFSAESFQKVNEQLTQHAMKGRDPYPAEVRFTTWTLKYPRCEWVEITRLGKHYEEATIVARHKEGSYRFETKNIERFRLTRLPRWRAYPLVDRGPKVEIVVDGQTVNGEWKSDWIELARGPGGWTLAGLREEEGLGKRPGLTGPIDDAFTGPFVCVVGTGKPWNPRVQAYADAELKRFEYEWRKFMRGDLPIVKDHEITRADINNKHLIVFGDPGSNSQLAAALPKLPLKWTRESVELAGVKAGAGDHVPVLIYPNPLSAGTDMVINSGHTFGEAEFRQTNAFLFPRLGDYALLRLPEDPKQTPERKMIGLFDERWQPR